MLFVQPALADHGFEGAQGDGIANAVIGDGHKLDRAADLAAEPAMACCAMSNFDEGVLLKNLDEFPEGAI